MTDDYEHKILIVGCGLLGSMIARPIAAFATSLAVGISVTIVDYDKVENRNSPGDLEVPTKIGEYKTDVVAHVYEAAGIPVKIQRTRVTEKSLWLAKGHSIIIGALDNVPSRQLLLKASKMYKIPYIDLGLHNVGGQVSWSHGDITTMPFVGISKGYKPSEEKEPACALVATRVYSAIVTECAAISVFIYISGHDPSGFVYMNTGSAAENGDMVNWYVSTGDGKISATAKCITPKTKQQE